MANDVELRRHCERRLNSLREERLSFDAHWRELAAYILPRRYKWLNTTTNSSRGSPINQIILDSTGTLAARNLAAGMISGLSPPTRPWVKLRIPGQDADSSGPVSLWLSEVERRMFQVMAKSNFYNALGVMYFDLVVFGTAPFTIYEDYQDVIRCYNSCAGEYFLASNNRLVVDTFYQEYTLTLDQLEDEFGADALSEPLRVLLQASTRSVNLSREVMVGHAIEPNTGRYGLSDKFNFCETYWEIGRSQEEGVLQHRGFYEFPCVAPRWDITSNDAYGRSPGMDALPDIKQLIHETKRKAQSIDKLVNPPMVGDIQLQQQPASLLPGGITYVSGMSSTLPGLRPVYQVAPPIAELLQDIQEVKARIKETFFNDLLLTITNLQTVRTATEIDARREEKLIMIGPVVQRLEGEALSPAINRIFAIMDRAGILPPAPPELQGVEITIEFVSMFAQAQRASASTGIERLVAFAGNLAGVQPDVLDKLDLDATVDEYASQMSVPPKLVRDSNAVAGMREQRQAAAAKQEAMVDAAAGVEGANLLSKTDVGGGVNALQAITGGNIA